MFKHSIFDLIRSLSKEEKRRFSYFISSPYFNQSQKIEKLYKEIMKHYPLFTHKQLTKEKLFYKLNPESNYKDSIIRDLLHDLQNLVLKFIVLERFTRAKNVQNDYLLKELIERKQDKLFLRKIERIENGENNYNGLNSESIYNFYLTEVNKFNFYTLNHYCPLTSQINSTD